MEHFIIINLYHEIKSNNIPTCIRIYTTTNLYCVSLCACVHLLDTRNTCTSKCTEDANGYQHSCKMKIVYVGNKPTPVSMLLV